MPSTFEKILKLNSRVIVSLVLRPDDYYYSRIENIDKDSISITMPSRKGRPMPFSSNSKLFISVLSEEGRYRFQSKVRSISTDRVRMVTVDYPQMLEREQMRQFYRVPAHLRVPMYLGTQDMLNVETEIGKPQFQTVYIEELSGGGGKLSVDMELFKRNSVVLDFTGTAVGIGRVEASIVRILSKDSQKSNVCFEFTSIEERERDKLVRYIFKRQYELRRLAIRD